MSEHNNNNSTDNISNHSELLAEDVQDNHNETVYSSSDSIDQASKSLTSSPVDQEQYEPNQQPQTDNSLHNDQPEQQTSYFQQQNQSEQQTNDYQQQNQPEQQSYYQQQQSYYQQQQNTQQPNYYQQQQPHTAQANYHQQQQSGQQGYYQQQQHVQQQSYYQQFNPQYGYYAPVTKTNSNALASLVLGICSIVFILLVPIVGFAAAIVALCLGPIGLKQIKQRNNEKGRGFAIAGIITSSVALFMAIVVLVIFVVIIASA